MFNIGQTLRIRIGPLKGYLCRVIALRRTDVTVKLDSQQKVLTGLFMMVNSFLCNFLFDILYNYLEQFVQKILFTVKCEHLSEVQGRSTAISSRYF